MLWGNQQKHVLLGLPKSIRNLSFSLKAAVGSRARDGTPEPVEGHPRIVTPPFHHENSCVCRLIGCCRCGDCAPLRKIHSHAIAGTATATLLAVVAAADKS